MWVGGGESETGACFLPSSSPSILRTLPVQALTMMGGVGFGVADAMTETARRVEGARPGCAKAGRADGRRRCGMVVDE